MYKYSFLDHRTRMAIAAPVTASDLSAAGDARRTRVAVAGATGYAGQELVRLLAKHPAVTLTAAMSSGASSTPRPLPALARIWDDAVMPLDIDHLVASADIVFLALPEAASAEVAPYSVFAHRHNAEIEQELKRDVTFVPHLVPLDRGILETIYVSLKHGTTEAQVARALEDAYRDAAFVRLTGAALPEIKHVAHTNFCDIGWKVDEGRNRLALIVVLDNLVQGAAGQALQKLNILLGLYEPTRLL